MKKPSWLVLLLIGVASGAAPVAVPAQDLRTLTIDDMFAIQRVGDPQISPDGEWVAYTVGKTDFEKGRSETRVWMISTDGGGGGGGGEAVPMTGTGSSASRPRWSPDGRYLSFLAERNEGKTQVWTLNRLGGEAVQLTDIAWGVQSYDWSPDGSRLLLTLRDSTDEDDEDDEPEPWVIDRLQFKRDNVGYLVDDRHSHLYVYTLADESLRQITSGEFSASQPAWSPDGRRVAFTANRSENPDANDNSDIWIVDADNTDKGASLWRVTTNPGSDNSPAWSPDGRFLAYVTSMEPKIIWYATRHLSVISVDGGSPQLLTTSLDRNVNSPRFAADGRSIYFGLEDSGERHLARIDVSGRNLTRPIDGHRRVSSVAMGPNGEFAALISEPHLPTEVFLLEDGELTRLTKTNDALMGSIRLGEVENIHFLSRDGTQIEGFLFTPPPPDYQPGRRYPTLLRIHGGPVSQYDFAFNFEAQLFAAQGYAVVLTNPRGSSGYGQDFSLAIWQDWGNKDYEDIMAGVDHVIERGIADPDRLGVGGWSYGGILTNYVITKTDRFKAAITGASEVLYVANYGHDHYQRQWEAELGLPWENRELWERISPFNYVENIVTPTLIMGGEKDWNVPILNSEQLYQALRRLGRETQLIVYPGEHHGIRRPSFQKDRYERYLAWYDRYVRGIDVPTSEGGS